MYIRRGLVEFWTQSQRRVLAIACLAICGVLAYRLVTRPAYIPDQQPETAPRSSELPTKLDPNTAGEEELAILPELGEKHARAIVAYRARYRADHPDGRPPFVELNDLLKVNGVGVAMLENLEPYLSFPTVASTQRATGR